MSKSYTVIDISSYITISNYSSVCNEVDGVLIRAGYRGYGSSGSIITDSAFEVHYGNFYGKIPVGVYFFTQAVAESEVNEEVAYLYNLIKDKDIKFPIYLNCDYSNSPDRTGRADSLGVEARTALVNSFCRKIKALGYRAGVMSPDSFLESNLDTSLFDSDYSILNINYNEEPTFYTNYDGWRYTNSGEISGINDGVNISKFVKDVAGWEGDTTDISNLNISLEYETTTYNRANQCPEVAIYNQYTETYLVLDRDFRVTYSNNKNAGTATATILGVNNYKGTINKTYTINKCNVNTIEATLSPTQYTYTGLECQPEVIITDLIKLIDYTVSYSDNINAGTAKATITGIINYTGTKSLEFTIVPKDISLLTTGTCLPSRFLYTGQPCEPTVSFVGLTKDVDFTVSYLNNIEEGTGYAIATGIGNYQSQTSFEFVIVQNDVSMLDVTLEYTTTTYNRQAQKPKVTIENLVENVDFKVDYFNNINKGTATARISGINTFTGTKRLNFTINRKDITELALTFDKESYPYIGQEVYPIISIETGLVEDVDYTTTYIDNVNPGTASVKITGIGNYIGGYTTNFLIDFVNIENCEAKYGKASIKTIFRVGLDGPFELYSSGVLLEEKDDYIINYTNKDSFTTFTLVTLSVTGCNGIIGDAIYRFRVVAAEPSTPIDYEDDGVYNFGDIELGDESAIGNYDFGDLDEGYPEETILAENTDIDFDALAGGMRIAEYDDDDGKNIDEQGGSKGDSSTRRENPDDGTYNFGDIDLGDETANGNYDYGDLDEGYSDNNVVPDDSNYDFNILCYEQDELARKDIRFKPGTEYMLQETDFYSYHSAKTPFDNRTGSYLVYKEDIINNRVRMTKSNRSINCPIRSDGWVIIDDIIKLIEFNVGTEVIVSGNIYQYPTGKGYRIDKDKQTMYISKKLEYSYTHRYGLSVSENSNIIGYAAESQLTKVNKNY